MNIQLLKLLEEGVNMTTIKNGKVNYNYFSYYFNLCTLCIKNKGLGTSVAHLFPSTAIMMTAVFNLFINNRN